ncbi:DUF4345 domain-containing protein [Nocardioides sp. JQ2195]|uniref:DUF4345 family protein n=1 Tax=Nocardioides sp. JQ2195 TaxID=2592334 RepID=UPI00143E85F8|nr:DUF4345 family protein [Nocardioides sp. JQ2195]QIX27285.1 DUF4345 domain-containing protein [Nocardioides sp. JQ2195]
MTPVHALATASYAAIGAVAFARPSMVPEIFGGSAPTADSRNEIRAVYGGLTFAIAAVGLASPAAVGVLSAGMASGRAASALVEPGSGPVTKVFVGVELALAGAYFLAARSRSRRVG